ncbi:MAG: hypothetical protein RIK00_00005, partial [Algiphilus sp.]
VPLLSDLEAEVTLPKDQPLDVLINYADLTLPLNTLRLGIGAKDADTADHPPTTDEAGAAPSASPTAQAGDEGGPQ